MKTYTSLWRCALRALALLFIAVVSTAHASNDNDWWSMGPVGGTFQVQSGTPFIVVRSVEAGGPAELAGVQAGDYIMGAYGKNFATTPGTNDGYLGAPKGFGDAIERAESSDGSMPLKLLRPGVGGVDVTVTLPVAGAFGPAYPLGSAKFDGIYQRAAGKIHDEIMADADGDVGYMTGFYGIILLADPNWNETTGAKPYRLSINKMRDRALVVLNNAIVNPVEATNLDGTPNDGSINDSNPYDQSYVSVGLENWALSTWSMFLAEYRAKTGDTSVDATIQTAADLLAGRVQTWQQPNNGPTKAGLMGHGGVGGDYPHISYAGINIINAHAMTAMAMLKTAGATIDDTKMQATWEWCKSCTNTGNGWEDGNIGYAWVQGGGDSSGRTAGVAFSMASYGGLSAADQDRLKRMTDYLSRTWSRMQHAHAYTVAGNQFYQFVLPYLPDRDQRYIMENQRMFYHFHRTTTDALQYFGGRSNNGGDGYVGTARVAYTNVAMAQAVASGNLTTIAPIDNTRIHADFQSPYLTWPALEARHVEIEALSQAFTVDITDYQGTSLVPADYSATWSHVSGPATATFTSPNTVGTTANFPQDGTYRIQLEVVDGGYTLTEPIDVVVDTSGGVAPVPASIVTEPTPQSTTLGGSATMSVTMAGDGPFLYEWFLDGSSLGTVNSSSTLNFTNVSGGSAGDYHCVITHPGGTLTSATASLTISDAGIFVQGGLWRDQFDGISGTAVSDLTNHASYPRSPSSAEVLTSAESAREIGDDYGSRWTGWVTPDVTGSYTFYLASDYSAELWLSTDEQPANKVLITSQTNDYHRDWDSGGQSTAISLTAGQRYYIEVLHKENGGSDYCGVAWQKPGEGVPADGSDPIPGQYLSYFTGGVHGTSVVMPPVFDSSSYAWSVAENVATTTSVGTVSATDVNTPLSYAITAGNGSGDFTIDSATGEITVANTLDFETTASYTLTVQATSSVGAVSQVSAIITVTDVYDATLIVDTHFEDSDGFTGYSGHSVLTTTTDNLGNQWSTPSDAQIWNASNIPPLGEQCLTLGVDNNASAAEIVIPGTDHGVGNVTFDYASISTSTNVTFKLSYRVSGGSWVQAWSTNVVGLSPDWAVKPWTTVSVDINQTGDVDLKLETLSGTKGVLVDTFKVKDNRPNVAPVANDSTMSVASGVAGLSVGFVDSSDANTGDPQAFAITAGNAGGEFSINALTGEITAVAVLDEAVLNQYILTVSVTDSLGLSDTATVTVNVTPQVTDLIAAADTASVQADVASGAIDVLANDTFPTGVSNSILGIKNTVISYQAGTSGTPDNPTVQGWSEHESEDGDITTGNVTGVASVNDNGSGLDAWVVTDNTTATGDWLQYRMAPASEQTTAGNTNGWILETKLRFIDDFGAGISTQIEYGNGSRRFLFFFELDASGDLIAQLWGDGGGTYTLTTGGTGTTAFHDILVHYDPATATASFWVDGVRHDEGSWSGDSNGANGVEWGNESSGNKGSAAFHSVTWSALEQSSTLPSGALASLNNGNLEYDPNGAFDSLLAGESSNDNVTYVIEGGSQIVSEASVTMTVNGVNDAPVLGDSTLSLAENVAIGSPVVTVSGVDPDPLDDVSFTITAGNSSGIFDIDPASGNITTLAALDYESAVGYALTVTGTSSGGLSDTGTVIITVTDVQSSDDSGGNGLNDNWEMLHFGSVGTVAATDDTDDDGMTVFQEMVFGSDPGINDSSDLPVRYQEVDDAGTPKLEFKFRRPQNHADLGVTYQLQTSNDMESANWVNDATSPSAPELDGDNEWITYLIPMPSGAETKIFARCRVTTP